MKLAAQEAGALMFSPAEKGFFLHFNEEKTRITYSSCRQAFNLECRIEGEWIDR
jgi:hypothetical protein